ncbi:MAG: superoxide dismutase, Ni [Thermoplasmata archaeon]|nr:superoxide dismutase, Ni [Thermoplasmata archaeon]
MSTVRARHLLGWSIVDAVVPPTPAFAHCDIPCGIYDPHEAQISALTVVRMAQLIGELPKPAAGAKPEDVEMYHAKLSRYMLVKEQHCERVKAELRVLWGDYFTPDHAKANPTLHETFWKAMKQASKARQGTSLPEAQELLTQTQAVAELFWKTKNVPTHRLPSTQKAGGELVYPAPAA